MDTDLLKRYIRSVTRGVPNLEITAGLMLRFTEVDQGSLEPLLYRASLSKAWDLRADCDIVVMMLASIDIVQYKVKLPYMHSQTELWCASALEVDPEPDIFLGNFCWCLLPN